MIDLEYKGKYYLIPDINGATVLNTIKKKIETEDELDGCEQKVFSILAFT